ncbi:MAG: glycosyltransferase family 2 protein [Pseudomonadota bacterium]
MLLSVIVPVFNEEDVLEEFYRRTSKVLDTMAFEAEILFVNDGGTDSSLDLLSQLRDQDSRVGIVDLSRNFGKEAAMTAGLDHSSGDIVVVIDADLQDPPELIPEMIKHWQDGYDVVYAKRSSRQGESFLKKYTARGFYRVMQRVSRVPIPQDTGDFRLMSRRAVDSLARLRETHRFMKGLFAWIGYPQKAILYQRDPRYAGETKWNYWKLWNFAIEGITSFTEIPLKLATYLGLFTALAAFVYGTWVIFKTIMYGDPVAGYPSLMVVVLFLGGVQLVTIGIIGEYLGRTFSESKQRPLYFVNSYHQSAASEDSTGNSHIKADKLETEPAH